MIVSKTNASLPRTSWLTHVSLLLLAGAALLLPGCDLLGDDESDDGRTVPAAQEVLVGNFGTNAAGSSITFYDPETEAASTSGGFDGVLTSLTIDEERAYATLNTGLSSGGLGVVALDDRASQAFYEAGGRPVGALRNVTFASDGRAYATDTNGGGLATGFADLPGALRPTADTVATPVAFPEGIISAAGKVFVANYGLSGAGTTLTVFAPGRPENAHAVDLGCDGPNELFLDDEDELVVVCQGKTVYNEDFTEIVEQTNAQVLFLDPETEEPTDAPIRLDAQVGSANGSQSAHYAPGAEALHLLSGGQILRIDTGGNVLDGTISVPTSDSYGSLSALAYDGAREQLYVARLAVNEAGGADFGARGRVVILDDEGAEVGGFDTGVVPAHIALRR